MISGEMKSLNYLNAHRLHTNYKDAKPASVTNLGNFEISPIVKNDIILNLTKSDVRTIFAPVLTLRFHE